ncbi:Oidioi.mRNA.OKI2018_I69.XSR.g15170.t3.cds [Oikopleura dioica]|uniref:Oidioi.mRNA.OKI2018_I69.XSR.g15170.t3.cds n=1 Tax=Oikopleura dioica TaxID=34765 RepID=A0ABN7SH33_OIKDI|nr:Oidioi.mRNA.OKI2018_I69.XSR.g15170.t3.cds [Oikopleura dioica]
MSLSHLFNSPSPLNQPNPSDLGYPRFPLQPTPFPVQPPGTNRNEIFVPQVPNVPKVFAHFGKGTEMLATYEKFESALRRGIPKVEDTTTPQPVLNFCANPTPNPNMNLPNQPDRQSQSSQNSSELVQEKDSQHGGEDLSKGDSEDNVSADNNANDTPQSSNGTSPVVKKRRPEVQLMPKPSIVAIPTATPVTFAIASTTAVPIKNSGSNPNTRSTAINSTVLNRLPSPSDNNHICSFCGKGWKTRSALEMHIRVHTGEEPFICALCGKGHKQKGQLKVHITKHHAGCSYPDPSLTAGAAFQHEKEKLKILRGARPIAPAPVDCSPKVNPVLSRQTEFDCHQCGLACHSWANLEKHLQAHEEADVAGDSTSENKMSILESDKMCSSDEERDKMSEGEG